MDSRPIVLIGASCRAAAQALLRIGATTTAWDLFADRDTKLLCTVNQIDSLTPNALLDVLELERSWVLPCGGLENASGLWNDLSRRHRVLGPTLRQLNKMRDPFWLSSFCSSTDSPVMVPEIERELKSIDIDRKWIVKNARSAGGLSVRNLNAHDVLGDSEYAQAFISGIEFGVTIGCSADEASILSVTVPIRRGGCNSTHQRDFRYSGTIGPITLPPKIARGIKQFFDGLGREIQFIGVLQADFILCDDQIYLLEINPRWTAGMEIAEMIAPGKIATQFTSQAGDRPSAFLNTSAETHFDSNAFVVKQIIYAKQSFVVSQEYSDCLLGQIGWNRIDEILTSDRPDDSGECLPLHYRLADIPESDSSLERGTPVCTLLVRGEFKDATSLDLGSRESFQWLEKLADRLHPLEQIWKPETRVPKN